MVDTSVIFGAISTALLIWCLVALFFGPLSPKKRAEYKQQDRYHKRNRRKNLIAGAMYLVATDSFIIWGELPQETQNGFWGSLLLFIGGVGSVGAVMLFAKTLHAPKSPRDAYHLNRRDDIEKSGVQYEYFPSIKQNEKSTSDK